MAHEVSLTLLNSWAAIVALLLVLYVALDGFDLGVGMLSLIERDPARQELMISGLGGVWDANETWLVLLGGVLFGAFPLVYAAVAHALYVPILLMLFGLIFRGVAFEFRVYSRNPRRWTEGFGVGSLIASLAQGASVGGLVAGLPVGDGTARVDLFAWATPLALLSALLLVATYLLLGAAYLLGKTEGDLRLAAYRWAWRAAAAVTLLLPGFFAGSARAQPYLLERWGGHPLWYGLLALAVIAPLALMAVALRRRRDGSVFFWCVVGVAATVMALAGSHYPYVMPGVMTLATAASSTRTLEFMLYAIGGLLPFMLAYNGYQYYVFRGRVRAGY